METEQDNDGRRPLERTVSRHWWKISIGGYGEFAMYATEAEAEEMRAHKARWEGGCGTKRRVTTRNKAVQKQVRWVIDYEIPRGYEPSDERLAAEKAVILAANAGINRSREAASG